MYRKAAQIRRREVAHAQGGSGSVTFYDWLLPEEAHGHGNVFSKLVIPPGASIGQHTHNGTFEAYLVLEGEATVTDNGETYILEAGDMNYCQEGDSHATENRTDHDLVLLALIMKA